MEHVTHIADSQEALTLEISYTIAYLDHKGLQGLKSNDNHS